MAQRRNWSDLRLGVIVALAIAGSAAAILVFARVGSLHGATFPLYVLTDEARGVIRGTEVWLDGQKVGLVEDIDFIPPTRTDVRGVVMRLDVLESARSHIRLDSRSDVRSGGSLISSPVLSLRTGTPLARAVVDGDTLRAVARPNFELAASRMATAAQSLPVILGNLKVLATQMRSTNGTAGALRVDGMGHFRDAAAVVRTLGTLTAPDRGSFGPLVRAAHPLGDRARAALALTDSVRTLIASGRGSLGRLRRDSTLMTNVAAARAELDTLRARAADPSGSIGRFRADSAVVDAIADARRQLDSLITDMRKRPPRYVVF